MMMDTYNYIAGTLFAFLLGFSFLYILGHRNYTIANSKKKNQKQKATACTSFETRNDLTHGDNPRANGSDADVIVVGAGVAGAALAHTLGKVIKTTIPFCSLLPFNKEFCRRHVRFASLIKNAFLSFQMWWLHF